MSAEELKLIPETVDGGGEKVMVKTIIVRADASRFSKIVDEFLRENPDYKVLGAGVEVEGPAITFYFIAEVPGLPQEEVEEKEDIGRIQTNKQ